MVRFIKTLFYSQNSKNEMLRVAVANQELNATKHAIEIGADLESRNGNGQTPIHIAAGNGDLKMVRMLVAARVNVNARIENRSAIVTPLHLAAERKDCEVVRVLLAAGTEPDLKSYQGRTPLFYAVSNGDTESIRLLLEYNADPRGLLNKAVVTCIPAIVQLLISKGADPNAEYETRKAPLYWAIHNGRSDVVEILLNNNAECNVPDCDGKTPLHYAVERGYEQIVSLLLEKGVDPNVNTEKCDSPLHIAAGKGYVSIVRLLISRGADPNAKDKNRKSPLCWAVYNRRSDVVKILLNNNAECNVPDCDGKTPLHYAAERGADKIVSLLLERGVDPNVSTKNCDSPLHIAAGKGHIRIVKQLLDCGADMEVRRNGTHTPLFVAIKAGDDAVADLLISRGAKNMDEDGNLWRTLIELPERPEMTCGACWNFLDSTKAYEAYEALRKRLPDLMSKGRMPIKRNIEIVLLKIPEDDVACYKLLAMGTGFTPVVNNSCKNITRTEAGPAYGASLDLLSAIADEFGNWNAYQCLWDSNAMKQCFGDRNAGIVRHSKINFSPLELKSDPQRKWHYEQSRRWKDSMSD